jgi:PAS domain S-box-containing protein
MNTLKPDNMNNKLQLEDVKNVPVRVLIVEDNFDDVTLIKELLSESDSHFELENVETLEETLDYLNNRSYDILLLDLGLPDSEGLDTFFKVHDKASKKPIIVLTGLVDKSVGVKAIQLGAQDYLNKGDVDGNTLERSIRYSIERKKSEDALKESEEKYRRIVENAQEGIWTIDAEGYTTYANERMAEMLGYTVQEMQGEPLFSFMDKKERKIAKTNLERRKQGIIEQHDFEFLRKDGERIYTSLETSPIIDNDNYIGAIALIADITLRKKAEESLRQNKEFLDNIIENIPNMIFVKSAYDLRFVRVNKAAERLLGYKMEELIGKSDYDFFPKNEADFFTNKDKEVLNKKKLQDIPEETILTKDLGERILHTKKIPLLDETGSPNYLLGISEDITESKKAENEMKRSLREKEVLLQEIHHRVKNNMQIILSIFNLQKDYLEDEKVISVINEIQNRVLAMALVQEKLYQSTDLIRISFVDYVRSLVLNLFYSNSVEESNITSIIDIDEDIKLNIETSVPCGLIISELVSNSLKHAFLEGRKGELQLSLKEHDDRYELTISDDGVGFPEDMDFKNTESLGLQLVNSLTNQIDGEITLDRSHGTKFKIIFKELEYKERY